MPAQEMGGKAQQLQTTLPAEPGSALVDQMATHYGVEGHPTGKTVWVELHGG